RGKNRGHTPIFFGAPPRFLLLADFQGVQGEERLAVGPSLVSDEPGAPGEGAEALDRILVRVLGVDRLADVEREPVPPDAPALASERNEVHLDAPLGGVVESVVREALQLEVGTELAVDAR